MGEEGTMDRQDFDWRSIVSSEEKRSEWHKRAGKRVPHRAWYFCVTDDGPRNTKMLEELKLIFWSPLKEGVALGVDVKWDVIADCPSSSFVRITMPERFVPHFTAEENLYVLYRATVGETLVDFGRLWDGVVPMETRLGASTHTIMGDLSRAMNNLDAPPPSGILRAVESKRTHTAEVVKIPPRGISSVRRHLDVNSKKDSTEVPVGDTLCPVPDEASEEQNGPMSHSRRSAWAVFGEDEAPSEPEPPVQLPPPSRPAPIPATEKATFTSPDPNNSAAGCLMLATIFVILIVFSFLAIF